MRRCFWVLLVCGCSSSHEEPRADAGVSSGDLVLDASSSADASVEDASVEGGAVEDAPQEVDAKPIHFTAQEELLALIALAPGRKIRKRDPGIFLRQYIGPNGPGQTNQGNPALARHSISRSACMAGLAGIELQTKEQREACGGHENMVPIYKGGDPSKAKVCIDIFEYPNRACELPMVWVPPAHAAFLCEAQGKRLCAQEEWVLACKGDPNGGEPSTYAYGEELDLAICNTNKSAPKWNEKPCDPRTIDTTWETCATNTEPAGAFPRCRSRFGVFDQHGNVAEAMTRVEIEDNQVVSQLKGSAFFYVDVARKLTDPPKKELYSDHCAHDPRWHVQPIRKAFHVNYHLGFRCCYAMSNR